MHKKTNLIASITLLLSTLGIGVVLFWLPKNIDILFLLSSKHQYLTPLVLIAWRILAIVIPPLPGGFVSYALLPVLGWLPSFIYASIGVLIGTSIAFWLGRIFREPLVKKFVPLQTLHKWEGKISSKTEFLAFLIIRLTTGPVLDFISYIAGLTKISYKKFVIATFISIIPEMGIYYLGEAAYKKSVYLAIGFALFFFVVFYVLKKKKFFEKF